MAKLGVLDVEGTKYTLKLGETYLIGRKADDYAHDIEIDDTSVDVKHCILDFTDRRLRLFDIRSKCGTFVDGTKVAGCEVIPIVKSTSIQFGNVESTLQLVTEGDSGYLEGRLTPPAKDNSEIICNSPENVPSSSSRLRNTIKNTLTSTPNATTIINNSIQIATKPVVEFLVPTKIPRRSGGSNTSAKSTDSFFIPETQCPVENNDRVNNSANVSIDTNKSNDKSTNIGNDDDDFFIPETQEVVGATGRLSNYPRVAFGNEDINETAVDGDKIPSSQFRICTQDFNGSGDELSNNSDDILANVPCSLVIPTIRHEPVQIDDFLNANKDEEEIEREMSALQWSKKTGDDAETSVTPDDIIPADGLVTPDLIQGVNESAKKPDSRSASPDMVHNPEQPAEPLTSGNVEKSVNEKCTEVTEHDSRSTEVFIKPSSLYKSVAKSSPLPCDKENIGPQGDDCSILPATQVFIPPPAKVKPVAFLPPPPPPSCASTSSVHDDDDLPPTQVFQMAAPSSSKITCFSSTLVDGMQLSENSFKAKCNKLLDSDDDEMDEIIAPELVKKMRESSEKPEEPKETLSTDTTIQTSEAKQPSKEKLHASTSKEKLRASTSKEKLRASTLKEKPKTTPREKFIAPATPAKNNSRPQPAVSIDNFLLTPDFLGKEISKDEKLQKLAEVNWKNLISEKQRKSLFGDEDSDGNPLTNESDDSQDSFNDLLPHKEKQDKTVKPESKKVIESKPPEEKQEKLVKHEPKKVQESKPPKKKPEKTMKPEPEKPTKKVETSKATEEPVVERITRRRKSAFPEESKESKMPRKDVSKESKAESDKKTKTESKTAVTKKDSKILKNVEPKSSKDSNDKKEDLKKSHKETSESLGRERIKLRRIHHTDKTEQEKDKKESDKKSEETRMSRRSEKSPKNAAQVATKRTTRQSSQELDKNSNESTKSKHHNERKDTSHNRLSASRDKSVVEHRNGFKQKESEKKNNSPAVEKSVNKILRSSSKEKMKSSTKSLDRKDPVGSHKDIIKSSARSLDKSLAKKDSNWMPLEDFKKKRENKSKDVGKVEKEEKPLPRFTRLRSAKELATAIAAENSAESANTKKVAHNQEKEDDEPKKDMKESTTKKDRLQDKLPKAIDLTVSDTEDTPKKAPAQIKKSNSASSATATLQNGKRKTEEEEAKIKRLRSASSTDSVIPAPLNESRMSRSQTKTKIAITMCDPRYQDILEKHSGGLWIYTKDPKECDVLVVEKGNRTYKLMVAIARGSPIVKLDWLIEVLKKKTIEIPFESYIFEDPLFQERHQFHMKKSLNLAKTTSLFDGISFMMTPGIRPIPDEMKDIIICAGGTVLEHIPKPQAKQRIFLVSQPKDNQYWHRFRRANPNIKIVTSEGVMSSVMQQSENPLIKSTIQ